MPARKSLRKLSILAVLIGVMALGPLAGQASASHFRGGSISYQQSGVPANANFESTVSFRCTAFFSTPCNANVGDPVTIGEATLQYGDASSADSGYTVVAVNAAEDYIVARKNTSHTYPDTSARTAFFSNCCTISTLENNADASYRVETLVNLAGDANSPKTSVPPVVNVGNSGLQSFLVPATDAGGQTLRFRLATDLEAGGNGVNPGPGGYSIDPATGRVTLDPAVHPDGLYHTSIVIEALNGQQNVVSSTLVTFLIRVGQQGSNQPPVYTAPTPPDGREFTVAPGNNLSCDLRATDPDAGDSVDLIPGPLPAGFTLNDTPGNPATGNFSFTPTGAQDGQDFVVNVTAQDPNGGSVFRSYTIKVRSGEQTTECGGGTLPDAAAAATGYPLPVGAAGTRSCDRRAISLVSANVRGRRVTLRGLVRPNLAGRSIRILANYGKSKSKSKSSAVTTLGTVKANSSGRFTASVRRPSRKQFSTARYQAQVGRARSKSLKLAQSLRSTSIKAVGRTIEVRGAVKRSLLGKRRTVTVKRLICGRYKTVGKAKPDRRGRYVVRFRVSQNGSLALFRAESSVLVRPGSKRYARAYARAISIRVADSTG